MSEYNAPGQPPYGQPPYGQQPHGAAHVPDHPQATLVLILGILGIVACGLIAPFAWVMGNRVVKEIDASQGQMNGRSTAQVGRICGIVGSALLILVSLFFVLIFGIMILGVASSASFVP